jgi:hypothetical protein
LKLLEDPVSYIDHGKNKMDPVPCDEPAPTAQISPDVVLTTTVDHCAVKVATKSTSSYKTRCSNVVKELVSVTDPSQHNKSTSVITTRPLRSYQIPRLVHGKVNLTFQYYIAYTTALYLKC